MAKNTKYIVLDTNMIVSFYESGFLIAQQSGFTQPEDAKPLDFLLELLNKNEAEMLIPEMVILECQRIKPEKDNDLDKIYEEALKAVQGANILNKKIAPHAVKKIQDIILKTCEEEKEVNNRITEQLDKIIKHKNTQILPLDEAILLAAYRRGLMGKKPHLTKFSNSKDPLLNNKPLHDIQPDCIIIESVMKFIESKKNYDLFLCTNDSNFYVTTEKTELDPHIKNDLHIKEHFTSLSEFLSKIFGFEASKKEKPNIEDNLNAFPLVEKNSTAEGTGEEDKNIVKN